MFKTIAFNIMKKTKRIKLKHQAMRKKLGFKTFFIPVGYYKNRISLIKKINATGCVGSIEQFKFYD